MTREQNLKIISDAVAKVSDTMELKFGCRIMTNAYSFEPTEEIVVYSLLDYSSPLNEVGLAFRKKPIVSESITKILGREAQLADIIAAMWIGEFDSEVMLKSEQEKVHELCVRWNMKVGLEHQTDETVAFIAELLK